MIAPALARFGEERMARTVPAGRIGEPEEIARAVVFLAGEAPAFLTGDVMVIDGGYLCQ
jgi:3-oxoacyl-[acyl-carrier protein] reductase